MIDPSQKEHFSIDEQMHICYVIGEWYLKWKNRDLNSTIGRAKEELKSMICDSKIGDFHGSNPIEVEPSFLPGDEVEICATVLERINQEKRDSKSSLNLEVGTWYLTHEGNHILITAIDEEGGRARQPISETDSLSFSWKLGHNNELIYFTTEHMGNNLHRCVTKKCIIDGECIPPNGRNNWKWKL